MGHLDIERASTLGAFHVAGVVVHVAASALEDVAATIATIQGARVHASSAAGKLVVTLEGNGTDAIVAGLETIRALHGVIAAALVYQHGECDENDAPSRTLGDCQ